MSTNSFTVSVPTPFSGRVVNGFQIRRIGHSPTVILCGLMGAVLGRFLVATDRRGDGE
jgi:hypothetical protein